MTPIAYLTLYLQPDSEPILSSSEIESLLELAQRTDGNGFLPTDPGWTQTYDLQWAVAEGWKLKAAKAASEVEYTAGQTAEKRQQLIEHCLKMAARFAGITTIPLRTGAYSAACTASRFFDPVDSE